MLTHLKRINVLRTCTISHLDVYIFLWMQKSELPSSSVAAEINVVIFLFCGRRN